MIGLWRSYMLPVSVTNISSDNDSSFFKQSVSRVSRGSKKLFVNRTDWWGRTLLQAEAASGNLDRAKMLLEFNAELDVPEWAKL